MNVIDIEPFACVTCGHGHGEAGESHGGEYMHSDICDCETLLPAWRFMGRPYDPQRLVCRCGGKRDSHDRGTCDHMGTDAARDEVAGLFIGTTVSPVCPCREWRPK